MSFNKLFAVVRVKNNYKDDFSFSHVIKKKCNKQALIQDLFIDEGTKLFKYNFYSAEELIQHLALSPTKIKNIKSLTEGGLLHIQMHSSQMSDFVYRLSEEDIQFMREVDNLNKELHKVEIAISEAIPTELKERQLELEKTKKIMLK